MFIAKHSKDEYSKTLSHAVEVGLEYTKALDERDNVIEALELLESYIENE